MGSGVGMAARVFERRLARALVIGAYWLAQSSVLYFGWGALLAESLAPGEIWYYAGDWEYFVWVGSAVGGLAGLQLVFLWPVRKPRGTGERGVSLWLSLGVAALAIVLLVGGVIAVGADVVWLVTDDYPADVMYRVFYGFLGVSWLVATPLLIVFSRRKRREGFLGRVASLLFLGTMVEVAATIPIDVLVRRRTDCYCAQGTYWTLTVCGAVGFFALGPAIFLTVLGRRRARWYGGRCEVCGYDMSSTPRAERCPECGAGWRDGQFARGVESAGESGP